MTKILHHTGLMLTLIMITQPINADAVVSSMQSSVEIVEPLTVNELSSMHFGMVAKPTSPVIVTVTSDSTIAATSTATVISDAGVSAGIYEISGEPDALVQLSVANVTTPTGFVLDNFEGKHTGIASCDPVGAISGCNNILLSALGQETFRLGARLTIPATTTGIKVSNFDVEVTYQ